MSKNHVSHSKFSLSKFRFDIIWTRTQAYSWHAGTLLLPCGSAVCFFKLCGLDWDPQYNNMGNPPPNFCLPDYTKYEIWNRGMTDILNSAEINLKVQPSNTKIRR